MLTALEDAEGQNAYLLLTFDGAGEIDLDMASLMPRDRFGAAWPGGGLRRDLVESLQALHPSFLRFPGGCVAEGSYYRSNFYNWKDTVGEVEQRKENFNTWGYMQSYGLGYYEYFCLSEAIGALPLPVVHAGRCAVLQRADRAVHRQRRNGGGRARVLRGQPGRRGLHH